MIKNKIACAMALLLPLAAYAADNATQGVEVLRVTSPADDGSQGTLHWALEKNNQNPGHYRIELQSTNTGAIVFNVPGLEHAAFIGNRGGGISNDTSKLEKICAIDGNVA